MSNCLYIVPLELNNRALYNLVPSALSLAWGRALGAVYITGDPHMN